MSKDDMQDKATGNASHVAVPKISLPEFVHAESMRKWEEAQEELTRLRAERESLKGTIRHLCEETCRIEAERDALRAQLARLTTLRPASEWDGETYVLWWREWDVAGWALDSISDSQESFYWTPAFDAHLPRAGSCVNSLSDGVVAPSLEPAHPIPTPKEAK